MTLRALGRAAALVLSALALAACAQRAGEATASPSPAPTGPVYPSGIVAPATWSEATRRGIYPSDSAAQCCFLNGRASLTLDNPPGAQLAVFTFYVPEAKPLAGGRERASFAFDGVSAGPPVTLQTGMQDATVTIPVALRAKRHLTASIAMSVAWIPKAAGFSPDVRRLSVMLVRVGYI